jgi:hypothetical protein
VIKEYQKKVSPFLLSHEYTSETVSYLSRIVLSFFSVLVLIAHAMAQHMLRIVHTRKDGTESASLISTESGMYESSFGSLFITVDTNNILKVYRDQASKDKKESWLTIPRSADSIQLDERHEPRPVRVKVKAKGANSEGAKKKKNKDGTAPKPAKKRKAEGQKGPKKVKKPKPSTD